MGGGDYDGDAYFFTWNKRLLGRMLWPDEELAKLAAIDENQNQIYMEKGVGTLFEGHRAAEPPGEELEDSDFEESEGISDSEGSEVAKIFEKCDLG